MTLVDVRDRVIYEHFLVGWQNFGPFLVNNSYLSRFEKKLFSIQTFDNFAKPILWIGEEEKEEIYYVDCIILDLDPNENET